MAVDNQAGTNSGGIIRLLLSACYGLLLLGLWVMLTSGFGIVSSYNICGSFVSA